MHGNPITGHYFVPCHLTTRRHVAFYLCLCQEGGAHCAFVMRALRIIIILYFICFCERQKHLLVNNKIIGNALQFAFPLKSAYECALLHHRASCLNSTSFQFGPCLPLPLSVPISTWTLCYLLTTFIDFERQQRHLGLLGPLTLSSICLYLSLMSIN